MHQDFPHTLSPLSLDLLLLSLSKACPESSQASLPASSLQPGAEMDEGDPQATPLLPQAVSEPTKGQSQQVPADQAAWAEITVISERVQGCPCGAGKGDMGSKLANQV